MIDIAFVGKVKRAELERLLNSIPENIDEVFVAVLGDKLYIRDTDIYSPYENLGLDPIDCEVIYSLDIVHHHLVWASVSELKEELSKTNPSLEYVMLVGDRFSIHIVEP
jgi:hypothetical protein